MLGHQDNDPLVAAALGLPTPRKGEFVSARIVPAREDRHDQVAIISGLPWALARPGDPQSPAPVIPRRSQDQGTAEPDVPGAAPVPNEGE